MKIGLVFDDSLDRGDGVQQYVLTIGRWLTEQGHEVHYLVGQTVRRDLKHVHSLSRNFGVRFNGNRLSIPWPANRRNIKALLKREQFDVLHIQMPYSPFLAGRVIKLAPANTKIVGTFHILPFGRLQTVGAQWLVWSLRRSRRRIQQVWSVSKPAAQFAKQLGIKSTVLPNVVEVDRFKQAAPFSRYKDRFTIVFLGRLVPRKGCASLLAAAHIWQALYPEGAMHLVICGDGPDRASLERWANHHHLKGIVEFTGRVSERDKARYLAGADLAVFPSLGGESFGIVLIEAMAAQAGVVLAGNNAGYNSVLGELPQVMFDARQPEELAQLINKLYHDIGLRAKLHRQQQQLVKQYDVAVVGQKLLSYYQAL